MTSIGKRASETKAAATGQEVLWLASSEPPASLLTFLRSRGLTLVSHDDATTSAPLRLLWIDPSAQKAARAPGLGGRRIAVMHPDPGNADALAQALRARGAEVVALSLNPDSLHRVETLDPDAVIMEAEDFCSSCWEIVRALWQHPRLRFATIVLATPELMGSQVTALDVHDLSFAIAEVSADYARIAGEAKRQDSFSFELARLGPSRSLRALLEAGRTLRVNVNCGDSSIEIDLAEQIVVGAQSPAGAAPGEGLLGVHALQFLLAQREGQVEVRAVDHPAHTNVMAPLDTALHLAHDSSSAVRPSGLHRPAATNPGFSLAPRELPNNSPAQHRAPAMHARTLIGVPAVKLPASLKAEAASLTTPARSTSSKSFAPPREPAAQQESERPPQAPVKSARKHATMIGMPVVARPEPQRAAPPSAESSAKPAPAAEPAFKPAAPPAKPSAPARPSRAPASPAATPSRSAQPRPERAEAKAQPAAAEATPPTAPARPAPEPAPAARAPLAAPRPRAAEAAPAAPVPAARVEAADVEAVEANDAAEHVAVPPEAARSAQFARTMLAAPGPQLAAPQPTPQRAAPLAQVPVLEQPPAIAFANTEPPPANPMPLTRSETSALNSVVMDEDWARPRSAWQTKLRALAGKRGARGALIGVAVAALCAAVGYGLSQKGNQISATPLPVAQAAAPVEQVAPAAKPAPTPSAVEAAPTRPAAAAVPAAEAADDEESDDDELDGADKREGARRASQLVKEANGLRRKKKTSAARARYLEALEALPDYPRALAGLVQLALAQGAPAEALDFAKQLVRARSGQGPYQLLLGDAQRASGNIKEARAAYQTALKLGSRAAKERLSEL